MSKKEIYNKRAIVYCEKFGIVEYRINGNTLVYNQSYPACSCQSRYTVQHKINLDTMEETVTRLKRFDPKGYYNV